MPSYSIKLENIDGERRTLVFDQIRLSADDQAAFQNWVLNDAVFLPRGESPEGFVTEGAIFVERGNPTKEVSLYREKGVRSRYVYVFAPFGSAPILKNIVYLAYYAGGSEGLVLTPFTPFDVLRGGNPIVNGHSVNDWHVMSKRRFGGAIASAPTGVELEDARGQKFDPYKIINDYYVKDVSPEVENPSGVRMVASRINNDAAWKQLFTIKEREHVCGSEAGRFKIYETFALAYASEGHFVSIGGHYCIRRGSGFYFKNEGDGDCNYTVGARSNSEFEGIHYNSASTVPSTTRCVLEKKKVDKYVRATGEPNFIPSCSYPEAINEKYFCVSFKPSESKSYSKLLIHLLYNNGAPIIAGAQSNAMTVPALVNLRGPGPGGLVTLCALRGYVRWSPVAFRAFTTLRDRCRRLYLSNHSDVVQTPFDDVDFILKGGLKESGQDNLCAFVVADAVRACVVYSKTWDDGGRSFKDRSIVKRADQALSRHVAAVVALANPASDV